MTIYKYILYVIPALFPQPLFAEIEAISPLQFGTIAILSNSQVETFQLSPEGMETTSSNILTFGDSSPAIFRVFNLDPNTPIVVTRQIVQNAFISNQPGKDSLELNSLSATVLLQTNADGEVIFNVGGVLSTNGDGSINYGTSDLIARLSITIDF